MKSTDETPESMTTDETNITGQNNRDNLGDSAINAPKLTANGKDIDMEAKSIANEKHAFTICRAAEKDNERRAKRITLIEAQYGLEPPKSESDQREKSKSNESNVSTGWLAGRISPTKNSLVSTILGAPYLTKSSLPSGYPNSKDKSDKFKQEATNLIRNWPEYVDTVNRIAEEDSVHGYVYCSWSNKADWKPLMHKQDKAWVPEQSGPRPSELQWFVVRHDYLLHDFIALFRDEDGASKQGWNLKNSLWAAENSRIRNPTEDITVSQFRKFADLMNEGSLGITYSSTAPRVVKVFILYSREYDGKVTQWVLERETGKLLYYRFKEYDKMDSIVYVFTYESGNNTIHGSKGLGRKLIALSIIQEKLRNSAVDATIDGSRTIFKVPGTDRNKLQMSVQGRFMFIDKSVDVEQSKIAVTPEMYLAMDRAGNDWAMQATSGYIASSNDIDGSKTATQASIDAAREQNQLNYIKGRFSDQFSMLVTQMQIRAYSDDNIKEAKKLFDKLTAGEPETADMFEKYDYPEAVQSCLELLKFDLTEDEIKVIRKSPASGMSHVDDSIKSEGITKIAAAYANNPNIDQQLLLEEMIDILAGPDTRKRLVIPGGSQTVEAEQVGAQLQEIATMKTIDAEVPVSPRNNHYMHAKTAIGWLQTQIPQLHSEVINAPEFMSTLQHVTNHTQAHMELGLKDPVVNPEMGEMSNWLKQWTNDLQQAIVIKAHTAEVMRQSDPGAVKPQNIPGQPAIQAPGQTVAPGTMNAPTPNEAVSKTLAETGQEQAAPTEVQAPNTSGEAAKLAGEQFLDKNAVK